MLNIKLLCTNFIPSILRGPVILLKVFNRGGFWGYVFFFFVVGQPPQAESTDIQSVLEELHSQGVLLQGSHQGIRLISLFSLIKSHFLYKPHVNRHLAFNTHSLSPTLQQKNTTKWVKNKFLRCTLKILRVDRSKHRCQRCVIAGAVSTKNQLYTAHLFLHKQHSTI